MYLAFLVDPIPAKRQAMRVGDFSVSKYGAFKMFNLTRAVP